VALADADERFSLPPGALGELIEGVRMDVNGVTYERFEELVVYCRRVAGAVGRVCLAIFAPAERGSTSGAEAAAIADDLGVAMQLTNILRDLREDAESGRVYLPGEDLRRFGVIAASEEPRAPAVLASLARPPAAGISGPPGGEGAGAEAQQARRLQELVRFEATRAQEFFERGIELVPLLDRRSAACVRAMAGIYHALLDRIAASPERVLRGRTSLPAREKVWVAARSMLGGRG
jgi:phytoene synthase